MNVKDLRISLVRLIEIPRPSFHNHLDGTDVVPTAFSLTSFPFLSPPIRNASPFHHGFRPQYGLSTQLSNPMAISNACSGMLSSDVARVGMFQSWIYPAMQRRLRAHLGQELQLMSLKSFPRSIVVFDLEFLSQGPDSSYRRSLMAELMISPVCSIFQLLVALSVLVDIFCRCLIIAVHTFLRLTICTRRTKTMILSFQDNVGPRMRRCCRDLTNR